MSFYDYDAGEEEETNSKVTIKVVLKLFICIVGVLGNIVVIFIIVILKEYKKSVTHWYVLQLALADSLFLLTLPFKVSEDLNNTWPYSNFMCKIIQTILFLTYFASVLFLMIMSIDRYIAVCHSFSDTLQRLRKRRIPYFVIAPSTWIIAILLCIPVMLHSHKMGKAPNCKCSHKFPLEVSKCENGEYTTPDEIKGCLKLKTYANETNPDEPYCRDSRMNSANDDNLHISEFHNFKSNLTYIFSGEVSTSTNRLEKQDHISSVDQEEKHSNCHFKHSPQSWIDFIIFNFLVMFVLPVLVMSICYGLIVRKLSSSSMRTSQAVGTSSFISSCSRSGRKTNKGRSLSKSKKDRRRVTIMCATLVSSFLICWLPFHTVHLAKIVGIPSEDGYICTILPLVDAIFAYLNSALNPFLYTFFGHNFINRWRNSRANARKRIRGIWRSTSFSKTIDQPNRNSKTVHSLSNATMTFNKKFKNPTTESGSHKMENFGSLDISAQCKNSVISRHLDVVNKIHDDITAADTLSPN